jgi:hypothetical protein
MAPDPLLQESVCFDCDRPIPPGGGVIRGTRRVHFWCVARSYRPLGPPPPRGDRPPFDTRCECGHTFGAHHGLGSCKASLVKTGQGKIGGGHGTVCACIKFAAATDTLTA